MKCHLNLENTTLKPYFIFYNNAPSQGAQLLRLLQSEKSIDLLGSFYPVEHLKTEYH